MKTIYESDLYIHQITEEAKKDIYSSLHDKNILMTGGTGQILSFFVDTLLSSPIFAGRLLLVVRNIDRARQRFSKFVNDPRLSLIEKSLYEIDQLDFSEPINYVISGAAKADPYNYAHFPVDVILEQINGVRSLMSVSLKKHSKFLFLSSVEAYGVNPKSELKEDDYSIVSSFEGRSCYNLAKITGENLCLSYHNQYGACFNIIRFSRIFGPTTKKDDTKALSQFLNNALNGQDIVLKSSGSQLFSYQYVADAVRAIAYVLAFGSNTQIYNSTNPEVYPLKEIAKFIASLANKKVTFEAIDEYAGCGYSKAKNAVLNIDKIQKLGFSNEYSIFKSIRETFEILKNLLGGNKK